MKNKKNYAGVLKSVLASFLGVQSFKNYEQDAQSNSFLPYIIVGILTTIVFVLGIYLVVNFVIL